MAPGGAGLIGARALITQALDEEAGNFYERFDFRAFPDREPFMLLLRIPELRVAFEGEGRRGAIQALNRSGPLLPGNAVFEIPLPQKGTNNSQSVLGKNPRGGFRTRRRSAQSCSRSTASFSSTSPTTRGGACDARRAPLARQSRLFT